MNFRVYLPKQRNIRSFFSRQYFRLKEKEEGFPKGGTKVSLFGSVPKARTAWTAGSEKTNTQKLTINRTQTSNAPPEKNPPGILRREVFLCNSVMKARLPASGVQQVPPRGERHSRPSSQRSPLQRQHG